MRNPHNFGPFAPLSRPTPHPVWMPGWPGGWPRSWPPACMPDRLGHTAGAALGCSAVPREAAVGTKPRVLRTPQPWGKPWPARARLGALPGKSAPAPCPPRPGPFLREPGPPCGPLGAGLAPCGAALGEPLSIGEVAALIGCSPWTVRQTLIPRGLPHFRFRANGRLIFYRDQVIRWIENQQGGKQ